jgi:hypothetical protein
MSKMGNRSQTKYPYLVTAVGVALMAVSEIYSYVRAMMFRAMFRPGAGSGFGGGRQFGGGFGFGLPGVLATIAVIIAIVGIVWLGLALRKQAKTHPS